MRKKLTLQELEWLNTASAYNGEQNKAICGKAALELIEYKRIEEELGINLITLFKALKNGIYVRNQDNHIEYHNNVNIGLIGIDIICVDFLLCKIEHVCKYDMYGKTWALSKEELL